MRSDRRCNTRLPDYSYERMLAMEKTVFRKESLEKVSSPEQLNDYIKVSNVSVWIIIGAALVLLAAGLVWSITANLQTTVLSTGAVKGGVMTCYLSDTGEINVGDEVSFPNGSTGTVTSVSGEPKSAKEIAAGCSDYEVYRLELSDWSYEVKISAAGLDDGVATAEIIIDSVKPISFIWK